LLAAANADYFTPNLGMMNLALLPGVRDSAFFGPWAVEHSKSNIERYSKSLGSSLHDLPRGEPPFLSL